jgi:hypothetical protein
MTAEEQTPRSLSPHAGGGGSQPLLVTFSAAARGRPVRPQLAKGQVAAEHDKSNTAKSLRQRHQKWRITIRSRAVRQHKAIANRIRWAMQESSHRHFIRRIFPELLVCAVAHDSTQPSSIRCALSKKAFPGEFC